jgi:hypothetical protein
VGINERYLCFEEGSSYYMGESQPGGVGDVLSAGLWLTSARIRR